MKTKTIKGYKVFKVDENGKWYCDGCGSGERFYYEAGKTYTIKESPKCCERGFHFCEKLEDCFNYYACVPWNKIALVEASGEVDKQDDDSKCATNKIKILKEIPFSAIQEHVKDGVNRSDGINWSNGINRSDGINWSFGVNKSYGVNESFGIFNSYGVDNSLFLANKPRTYSIFGKDVSVERFDKVKKTLYLKLNGWQPTFNNLKSLYLKFGSEWKLTPIPKLKKSAKKRLGKVCRKKLLTTSLPFRSSTRRCLKRLQELRYKPMTKEPSNPRGRVDV